MKLSPRARRLLRKFLPRLLPAIWFGVRDITYPTPRRNVMIVLNGSAFDADIIPLMLDLLSRDEHFTVTLVAETRAKCLSINGHVLGQWPQERYRIVEDGSPAFYDSLLEAFLVFLTTATDLFLERLFGRSRIRAYVRLHHSVLGKADYRLTPKAMQTQRSNGLLGRFFDISLVGLYVDVTAVASKVEAHCCAVAEGGLPNFYHVFGYPRFERCNALASGKVKPWLPEKTMTLMEQTGTQFRVLYAPTHKDQEFDTTFFPLHGFDSSSLRRFLREQNIALFLRLHPVEEQRSQYSDLVDGESIFLLGKERAPSVIELMPFMGALITDYSSIFFEFLAFDRPILFVQDRWESYEFSRGFVLEYDQYFPGPKVTEFKDLLRLLKEARQAEDHWKEERAFVRKVLLPHLEGRFIDQLMEHEKVSRLLRWRTSV
jgi:hypothetical protein